MKNLQLTDGRYYMRLLPNDSIEWTMTKKKALEFTDCGISQEVNSGRLAGLIFVLVEA